VCPDSNFDKKLYKMFKISSLCPLIILTKGDTMINNMVLSREIEWIGYEHKRNMLQVEFIIVPSISMRMSPKRFIRNF